MASRAIFASFVSGALLAKAVSASQTDCRAGGSSECNADATNTSPWSSRTHAHHFLLQKMKTTSSLDRGKQHGAVTLSSSNDVIATNGLKYADDHSMQVLDIYTPNAVPPSGGWVTVIGIHGVGGSEKSFRTICQNIAHTGRQCLSIDYNKIGYEVSQDGFDACSSKAIDWALRKDIASTYNIDTSRIFLIGQSRGGFITGDLALRQDYDQTRIAGAIILNGLKKQHSEYLDARDGTVVPFLVLATEDDGVVDPKWSDSVVADLESRGSDVTYISYPAGGHNIKTSVASLYEHVSDFLRKYEKSAPPQVGSPDKWLSVCREGCECFDAGAPFKVADLSACEDEADKLGHRYIMYNDKTCATTLKCDDSAWKSTGSNAASGQPWNVYWRILPTGEAAVMPPTPRPSPPPPSPEIKPCENWCATNAQPWSTKCEWEDCGGCGDCSAGAPAPPAKDSNTDPKSYPFDSDGKKIMCRNDCASDTRDWGKKCTFNRCRECSAC